MSKKLKSVQVVVGHFNSKAELQRKQIILRLIHIAGILVTILCIQIMNNRVYFHSKENNSFSCWCYVTILCIQAMNKALPSGNPISSIKWDNTSEIWSVSAISWHYARKQQKHMKGFEIVHIQYKHTGTYTRAHIHI